MMGDWNHKFQRKKIFFVPILCVYVFPGMYVCGKRCRNSKRDLESQVPLANKGGHYEYKQREIRMSLRSYCLTLIIYASKEVLQVYWCFLILDMVVLLRGILYIVVSGCIVFDTHYILWCISQNILYLGCIVFVTPRCIAFLAPRCIANLALTIPN